MGVPGGQEAAPGTRQLREAFVGRARELALLEEHLDKARSGACAVLAVEGPAGIGKTGLVRRLWERARDVQVLAATADECEACLAGGVVAQLMLGVDRAADLQPPRGPVVPGDPFAAGADLLDLLGRLQETGPVAVVVDDVQWADAFSVQALGFALRRLQTDQVVALFSARDEAPGLPETLRRLAADRGVIVRLGGLDPPELGELASILLGRRLSHRAAQELWAHTQGHPLHARALLEELGIDGVEGTGGVLPAPRSFAMVVVARLAACAAGTVDLVQAAAVLGPRAPLSKVAAVGAVPDPLPALDEAVAVHLLEQCSQRHVAFAHPLVRAAVYHDIAPSRRSVLHAAAAEVLEGSAALFHRVEAALVDDPVLAGEVEAYARDELARGALEAGADALLTAARLTVDCSVRQVLVLDALEALINVGQLAKAAAVAKDLGGFPESPRRRYLLSRLALFGGRQDEAEALLTGAWRQWEQCGEGGLGALIAADMAQVCAMQLRSEEAADWARRAIDASADPELTTTALSVLVPCLGRVGRPDDAMAATAVLIHDEEAATVVHIEGLLGRGIVRLWVDDLEPARADLAAVVAACRDRPAGRQALVALGMLADTEYRLGAWDDSIVHAAQLVSLVDDSEQVWFGAFAHSVATRALAPRGHFERAEYHVQAAATAGRVMGDATSVGCAATAAAHVAFFRGDLLGTIHAVEPMLELGARADDDDPSVHPWRELHVEALLRLGRLEDGEAALAALEALAASRHRRSSLANAARLRGALEAARGRHDAARASLEAAVRLARELSAPFERARALQDYGGFLRRQGERRAATAHLRAAWETFTSLDATPVAERCQQEVSTCGSTTARPASRSPTDLTPQELAVTRLVIAGLTNREIATELIVSPKTVEYHLGHVYSKLGVRSRTQLAAVCARPAPQGVRPPL